MCACMYVCMYVYAFMCVCLCVYVCVCTYAYISVRVSGVGAVVDSLEPEGRAEEAGLPVRACVRASVGACVCV